MKRSLEFESGFTLIELSLIILIIGIVLTIGVVSYSEVHRAMTSNYAATQIRKALERAYQVAHDERVSCRLVLYGTTKEYEFLRNEETGTGWQFSSVNLSVPGENTREEAGHWFIGFPSGTILVPENDTVTITFKPRGAVVVVEEAPVNLLFRCAGKDVKIEVDEIGKIAASVE